MSGTAANVLVGSATLRVAPIGSTVPAIDGTNPVTWDTAWKTCGYTEDGTEIQYQPTFKDINVDEEMAPVKTILTDEKASINAKLAEATMTNLHQAISASTLTPTAATSSKDGIEILKVGSGAPAEVMVGLEGVSPAGLPRIIIAYRAMSVANVQLAFKKTDKTVVPVEFRLLADSSKPAGERLFVFCDHTAVKTA